MKFGVIVGNREFFPGHLTSSGGEQILAALRSAGHEGVCLSPEQSRHGAVETRADAKACAELFRRSGPIDGIIVTLPNYGDERGIAEAIRLADLSVPVLVQATPDDPGRIKASPMTFVRISTGDATGKMRGYVGEGGFTGDPLDTFGGAGVVEIGGLQSLLHFIRERGFGHHVAGNLSRTAGAVYESTRRYLGWEMSRHTG